jgi:hypothetical protein
MSRNLKDYLYGFVISLRCIYGLLGFGVNGPRTFKEFECQ